MYIIPRLKKVAAMCVAVLLTITIIGSATNDNIMVTSATPDISEYQQKIDELDQKQAELDKQIEEKTDDIAKELDKLDAINEQIDTVSEKIETVQTYALEIENQMADLSGQMADTKHDIEVKTADIESGLDDFMSRLRAMYVAGTDTYTDMIINSSDFYDVLMRLELIKRVASHDNDTIDALIEQKNALEEAQAKMIEQSDALKETAAKYSEQQSELAAQQDKLDELKTKSSETVEQLSSDKADLDDQSDEVKAKITSLSKEAATATTTTTTTTTRRTTTTTNEVIYNYDNGGSTNRPASTTATDIGTEPADDSNTNYSSDVETVVNYAKSNVGGIYVWGGSQYRANDCSGLVMLAYAQVGISLPHLASAQAYYGTSVAYEDMMPGDLIFFGYGSYASIYHVGMYIGDGKMVEAQSSETGIVISYMSNVLRYSNITAIKRLL